MPATPDFLALSRILTGLPNLDAALGADYEAALNAAFAADFAGLLALYTAGPATAPDAEEALRQALAGAAAALHTVAREIITLWFTGQGTPLDTPVKGTPRFASLGARHYAGGALWAVIQAHAPGYTNAGYGAWAQPPATPIP